MSVAIVVGDGRDDGEKEQGAPRLAAAVEGTDADGEKERGAPKLAAAV